MNVPQRAVLLIGSLLLIVVVLFADGMNWDGLVAIALGGAAALSLLVYVLRNRAGDASMDEWRDRPIKDFCSDDEEASSAPRALPAAHPKPRVIVPRSLVVSAPLRSAVGGIPRRQRA